jgi:ABC-2 type transport system permease protein
MTSTARRERAGADRSARAARMSLWRLEWLRLTRTPRAIALAAIFLFIGFIEPVATKYENDLISRVGHGQKVTLPPPTAADGLGSYVSEISVVGLVVVVAIAASALSFDARTGLAIFLRTRVTSLWALVLPRFGASVAAASVAYVLGTLAACYETIVLIGSLPAGQVAAGAACFIVYLTFAVAVTAFASSLVRSTIGTVAITLGILLVLPVAAVIRPISNWLPSNLPGAPAALAGGSEHWSHFGPSIGIAIAAGVALLFLAVRRQRAREI